MYTLFSMTNNYRRPRIAIDLDNTLANTIGAEISLAERIYGIKLRKEDFILEEKKFRGLNTEETERLYKTVWEYPTMIKPISNQLDNITSEIHNIYHITIFTATNATEKNVVAWLNNNRIAYDELNIFPGKEDKFNYALGCNINVFIDDHPELIKSITTIQKRGILLLQPWVPEMSDTNYMTVAKDWGDIEKALYLRK